MLPKIHNSERLIEIIQEPNSICINVTKKLNVVAGPVYHTSQISEMLHIMLKPGLSTIAHVL